MKNWKPISTINTIIPNDREGGRLVFVIGNKGIDLAEYSPRDCAKWTITHLPFKGKTVMDRLEGSYTHWIHPWEVHEEEDPKLNPAYYYGGQKT